MVIYVDKKVLLLCKHTDKTCVIEDPLFLLGDAETCPAASK